MPAKEYPIGTFGASEATPADPDIRDMPLSELSELIKWPSKLERFAEERQEPEPIAPEPEPEPPPVEPTPESEPAQEAAPPAEPEKPVEPSQEDIDRELLSARIEAAEAHAKKLEAKLAGREAGERGYINQLKEQLRRAQSSGESSQEPEYRPEPAEAEVVPQTRDSIRTWAIQKASQEAVANFMASHQDLQTMEQDAAKYLQESGFDARNIYQLDDPIAAGREMTRVLEEAYWHVKETAKRTRVAELQVKKADQVRGLEEAKRRAASSASGSTPPPPHQHKTTKDLSLAELEAKMKALSRR